MYKRIADFVGRLGYLPEGCPVETLKDADKALAERIRNGARAAAELHPEIDAELEESGITLELAIAECISSRDVDFSQGILGIASERVYQAGKTAENGEVIAVWKKANADYAHIVPEDALSQACWTYESVKGRILAALGIAKRIEGA